MFRITASGSYYSGAGKGGKEIIDFENVVGVIPEIEEERIQQAVMWRLILIWISKDARYTKRFDLLRNCYIDKVEVIKGKSAIIGKNVKELAWEELEELAVWKNLKKIPEYKKTDIRTARERAYIEYASLFDKKIDPEAKGYNYAELPDLVIADDDKVAAPVVQRSNDEIISEAQQETSAGTEKTFSLPELKKIAKAKKIKLPANVTHDQAYALVMGDGK